MREFLRNAKEKTFEAEAHRVVDSLPDLCADGLKLPVDPYWDFEGIFEADRKHMRTEAFIQAVREAFAFVADNEIGGMRCSAVRNAIVMAAPVEERHRLSQRITNAAVIVAARMYGGLRVVKHANTHDVQFEMEG